MRIEELIHSIGGAVQETQKNMEQRYLGHFFSNYFEEEVSNDAGKITYRPKTVEIRLGESDGDRVISAPIAALVANSNMNVDYVKVNLNINVTDEQENVMSVTAQPLDGTDNTDDKRRRSGEIELMFKCRNSPEGVARIETYLNGTL